jgi:hypothetical protein
MHRPVILFDLLDLMGGSSVLSANIPTLSFSSLKSETRWERHQLLLYQPLNRCLERDLKHFRAIDGHRVAGLDIVYD